MLLKIGDFAKLSRVSTRMLRHYDMLGLLKPTIVDPITRYRYYSIDQVPRLRRICALRDLAFTLEDIVLLLNEDEEPQDLRLLLRRKQQELHQRIAEDQARLQRIAARLGTLDQEYRMEYHDEHAALIHLLTDQYQFDVVHMELIHRVDVSCVYVAHSANGVAYDVTASRTDGFADNIYTTWLSGYSGQSATDFLLSRAGVLMHLEGQQYPTQRVVRTRAGEILGANGDWSTLVTTTLPNVLTEPTADTFRAMGAALGRLHTLSTTPMATGALPIGIGWFYPEHALREALHYLMVARERVPAEWHALLSGFHSVLHTIQQTPLPRTLIHGDPFIEKAVITDDGTVTFREWHSGGLGVAVLDLGRLLYACHLNPQEVWPWTITPNQERITAVLDGYRSYRTLSNTERGILLEAVQFGISYGATAHIARAMSTGWTPKQGQRLAVRQQWFEASSDITRIARAQLA